MIASRGKEGKQVAPSVLKENALINRHFYALPSRVEKPKESDANVGKFSLSYCNMSSFYVGEYG